jgi:glycosyltransferase involved in cell wall biosynthesis
MVDEDLRARCEIIEEIVRSPGGTWGERWLQRFQFARSLLHGNPGWVTKWGVRSFGKRARSLVQTWQPDVIQIEYHVMGQYVAALHDCVAPRVLVQHDPGAAAARDRRQARRGLSRLLSFLEAHAWARYERAIMREMQAIVVFTERDRRAIATLTSQVPIHRIPIGTALPERPLDPLGHKPLSLCFVGSFIHPPNTDAAERLISAIFPLVRAELPELVLYVIGDNPPARIRELAGPNVFVTGRVPTTSHYLNQAALVAVPLRLGGGMRVKVLEALAAGKAVVASRLAIEGLDLTNGEQVILAETDHQFGDAIAALLRDPGRRVALAQKARAWACANLGWEQSVKAYEALYTSLITG